MSVMSTEKTVYPHDLVLHTDGSGLWGFGAGEVRIESLTLTRYECEEEEAWGCLDVQVEYSPDGLIYTDAQFLKELREHLFGGRIKAASEMNYSEQGMQNGDRVNLDLGPRALSWLQREVFA